MFSTAIDEAIATMAGETFPQFDRATAVAKFLETDTGTEMYSIRCLLADARAGGVTVGKLAADAMLEAQAESIRKADPSLSPEQAYVHAMDQLPDVAAVAVGRTT